MLHFSFISLFLLAANLVEFSYFSERRFGRSVFRKQSVLFLHHVRKLGIAVPLTAGNRKHPFDEVAHPRKQFLPARGGVAVSPALFHVPFERDSAEFA